MPSIEGTSLFVGGFLLLLLLVVPSTHAGLKSRTIQVVVTNNHTTYLSIRCFSFKKEDPKLDVKHLPRNDKYTFNVTTSAIYPSSTMFNCSTNMGTFIAFRYDYKCLHFKTPQCNWKFDENNAYRLEDTKNDTWVAVDYSPNYESLDRGGVIEGYFAN